LSPIFPGNRAFINIGVNPALDIRNGFGFPFNPGGTNLVNMVVDGGLSQFPIEDAPQDGRFTDNTISFPGNGGFTCFDMSDASGNTRFQRNECVTVDPGKIFYGVFMTGSFGNAVTASGVGHCSLKPDRICSNNSDCNLLGFDPAGGTDTCRGAVTSSLDSRPTGTLIEDNTIAGSFQRGISADEIYDPFIRSNAVTGVSTSVGIFLRSRAIERSTVEENRFSGNNFGISLSNGGAPTGFGALITHNEVLGNLTRAISASATWAFPADLPENDWGLDCSVSGGFRNFNEPDNAGKTDSPNLLITDSNPFGESILIEGRNGLELLRPLPLTCAEQ
jgi:parallel beta-helix repeat protein